MRERELFKKIIDKSLKTNDMAVFNMMVVALISSHNNVTKEEIKKNCKSIDILIDILNDYPDVDKLRKNREQLMEYNEMYLK